MFGYFTTQCFQRKTLCEHAVLFISPPDSQLSAVDSLIDSMMLVENGEDDDAKQKDIFKVHNIPNPAFQRLFQVLQTRRSRVEATLNILRRFPE